jgi:hypothetical protein
VLAIPAQHPSAIPFTLYPIQLDQDGFRCRLPAGERWLPGDRVDLIGPIGHGFSPPTRAERWLLVDAEGPGSPLEPLIGLGLRTGAAIALTTPHPPAQLPADVELLASAADGLAWADYLAANLGRRPVTDLHEIVGISADAQPPVPTEVLLARPLPCGFGGCLGCGVAMHTGWALACQHGPVFAWDQLRV